MDCTTTLNLPVKKEISIERLAYFLSLTICGLSIIYLLSVFITGHSWIPFTEVDTNASELTLSLIQCLLGTVALHLPMIVTKIIRLKMPDTLCAFFYLFVLCGTVLGEVFSLYYTVPIWDSLLHFSSGIMGAMLGSILIINFIKQNKCDSLITPAFVLIAAICFSICIGVVWEIYEFAGDSLLGLNMQKSMLQDGTGLVGHAALVDTMKDLIVDTTGAVTSALCSYFSLKRKKGWLNKYQADTVVKVLQESALEGNILPNSI